MCCHMVIGLRILFTQHPATIIHPYSTITKSLLAKAQNIGIRRHIGWFIKQYVSGSRARFRLKNQIFVKKNSE